MCCSISSTNLFLTPPSSFYLRSRSIRLVGEEDRSMGCISSKILTKSGSLQDSKGNGDQFLALLRTSSSAASARRSKAGAADDQNPAPAAAKIDTINVSELLAGLEEEEEDDEEQERQDDRKEGEKTSPRSRCVSDGAAGSARSFRTLEEFDAMVSRCSSPEHAGPATELASEVPDASVLPPLQSSSPEQDAVATASSGAPGQGELARGAKRRARARQLGELRTPAPAVFDFRKSGSLREWLLGGGPIFSPGSYVTPKFGKVAAAPSGPEEHGERLVFDPELVAQLEEAMDELSVDEERVLREVLEVLEAGETETEWLERLDDRAAVPGAAVQD